MSLAVPLTHLVELAEVEHRLAVHLSSRDQEWAAEPSGLPGWTRAHVAGHLSGNAQALVNLVTWANTGNETPMYPSAEARAAEIERRAQLPWAELVAEQEQHARDFEAAVLTLTEPVAERQVRLGSGVPTNVCDLAATRIREVEVHRVDLADDYRPSDWSAPFTGRTLGQAAPFFRVHREVPVQMLRASDTGTCWVVGVSGPDLVGRSCDLLAWLLGRPHEGLTTTDGSPLPTAPAWV